MPPVNSKPKQNAHGMTRKFDIIDYLSGLTNFVFDKAVLNRVALDCGVSEVTEHSQLTDELKGKCMIALLKTIVFGPHSTASSTNQHGAWTLTVGSQTITAASLENIRAELKRLCKKYGDEETLEMLEDSGGYMDWVNEEEW